MSKIPVGLQLYTLRNETAADFVGTLKKVAEMGFQTVEFAGYGGLSASELRKVLDDLGLRAISSHVGYDQLTDNLDQLIAYNVEIGSSYLVCPWLHSDKLKSESEFQALMDAFRNIGDTCNKGGLTFAYHNHAFEFEKVNGDYILDRMYQNVDSSLMQAELDLYWVKKGGLDPVDYLLSYKGRVPLIHVKDMAGDEEGSFAEVGHGIIDFPAIFAAAKEAGVKHYIVEQDSCKRPPLESIQMSINYLKSIGIA